MSGLVYNYLVIRFRPYRDIEEFCNVGIVLACDSLNYFGFKIEVEDKTKIKNYFPNYLHYNYANFAYSALAECERWKDLYYDSCHEDNKVIKYIFDGLTKSPESVIYFSGVKSIISNNSEDTLNSLFKRYVEFNKASKQ